MFKEGYTVLKEVEVSFEEKKSLFICNIKRINSEKEAMDFIASVREKYKDATHNVYAYITNNGISMRYSDDGEPQGTAGPPVLEVLKREKLNDVAAVITRYFGGTLLGAGGLVRAYTASCKQGVDEARKVKTIPGCSFEITCEYDRYGKLNNYLQSRNIKVMEAAFLENIKLRVVCLEKDFKQLHEDIVEMMNGAEVIAFMEELRCFVDENEGLMEV